MNEAEKQITLAYMRGYGDTIEIKLTEDAAIEELERITGTYLDAWSVVKDGLTFTATEHGSVHVNLTLHTVISANSMADIIIAAGLLADRRARIRDLLSHPTVPEVAPSTKGEEK